jgi:multicomponent Na+:H+ antiporter subunit B
MKFRLALFAAGAAGLLLFYVAAFLRLPAPGKIQSLYGELINRQTVSQRHVTDAVTAVNFDYRGFDTIGEEYILFISVMGTLVILREAWEARRKELPDAVTPGREVRASDAVRIWILLMVAPKVLWGIYIVTHGQLTPGGGFQGGVILATAPLIIYLGDGFGVFKRITSFSLVELAEAIGAGGYVLIGMAAWLSGREFLTNVLPLGKTGQLTSGGTVPWISLGTGLEVSAGFVLLLYAFLQETLTEKGKEP